MDQNQDQPQDQSPSTPKQQVVERLKQANNVLVTVKTNPNVDELASVIGLTLMLNKLGKHATAVFSGEVPSTLEFLKPEDTIETNTDSLRDFIVSLDKSKADKLRYKVEENVVKIFITPYKTSISQDDLEFTQGDFNVDAVVALGVTQREELDQAITTHGRILHDATVITVTAGQDFSELGQINWQEAGASSLSEMLVSISEAFQGGLIDEQIATAFLTGIVSETERFSNPKTSPKVMTMSAQLMAAGANQQLIANELEKAVEVDINSPAKPGGQESSESNDTPADGGITISDDGTLSIGHDDSKEAEPKKPEEAAVTNEPELELPEPAPESPEITTASPELDAAPPTEDAPAEQSEPLLPPSSSQIGKFMPPKPEENPATDSFNPLMPEPESKPSPAEPLLPPAPNDKQSNDDGQIHIDTEGNMMRKAAAEPKHKVIQPLPNEAEEPVQPESPGTVLPSPAPITDDVKPGGDLSPATDVNQAPERPNFRRELPPPPVTDMTPSPPIKDNTTLQEIEESVASPHLDQQPQVVDSARDAVVSALSQNSFNPAQEIRNDLNAMPLGAPPESTGFDSYRLPASPQVSNAIDPATGSPAPTVYAQPTGQAEGPQMSPPPVPPPMMPR